MSYEKLSHISTFKDGRITLTTACNNLTPITYEPKALHIRAKLKPISPRPTIHTVLSEIYK